jgi:quercetin dioxygenase-like cupin family protein
MIATHDGQAWRTPIPGIRMRSLCHGDRTLMTEFRLTADAELPVHAHPHEQTGYLVSGALRLTVGDETRDVGPGDSWCVPGDVLHGAHVLAESVAIEVFSPVREDYLP